MKCRILKTGICLLCLLLLASGCSERASKAKLGPQDPVAIGIWHYYNNQQKIAFDSLVTEFNETVGQEQGIVVGVFSQGTVTELVDAVIAAEKKVGAGKLLGIFAAYPDTAHQAE